jgi:hypothetical protein
METKQDWDYIEKVIDGKRLWKHIKEIHKINTISQVASITSYQQDLLTNKIAPFKQSN